MNSISRKTGLIVALAWIAGLSLTHGQALQITPLPNTNLKDLKALLLDDRFINDDHSASAEVAEGYWDAFSTQYGFKITKSNRASDINTNNLKNFNLIVVNYTSNIQDYLNADQENAFNAFVTAGGSVIGYHTAAMPREGEWEWYRENVIVGLYNPNYHGLNTAKMVKTTDQAVLDLPVSKNILTGMPDQFQARDEWYAFDQGPQFINAKVLYYIDESSLPAHTHQNLQPAQMALPVEKRHPILWYKENPTTKSKIFYTGIIHNPTGARTDFFKLMILRAAEFASGYKVPDPVINAEMLKRFPDRMRILTSPNRMKVLVEDAGNFSISLRNIRGEVVRSLPFNSKSITIERDGIPPGNYLLQISSQGKLVTAKLVSWL